MIVPVAFSIHRENRPEDFVVDRLDLASLYEDAPTRVRLVLYDTDTEQAVGIEGLLLWDKSAPAYHELATIYRSTGSPFPLGSREYLRALRSKINELLDEESAT